MSITLWGRSNSANVQKVLWALGELELDYTHIELGGSFGGTDHADYLALNPNGKVPTLSDGEVVIWESHAIVRYLSAEYGRGRLWPEKPAERAPLDQWTDWVATRFQPAWIDVFWKLVRTPEAERDSAAIAASIAETMRCFAIMSGRLGQASYLSGERLGYADIVAGVAMYRWTTMATGTSLPTEVLRWHERLLGRPTFTAAVNRPYPELVGRSSY